MKKNYELNDVCDYDFVVFAINSHTKAYKLCWKLNQQLGLNFEITNPHKINKELEFLRYRSESEDEGELNLISNRSKKGYMIPSKKSVNYFLIIGVNEWGRIKSLFLSGLREINDILLVFELDLQKEKYSDRFIIYDKKN